MKKTSIAEFKDSLVAVRQRTRLSLIIVVGLLLAACTDKPPTPTPDDSVLRDGYMPKVLVTIAFSPTPPESETAAIENTPFVLPTTTPPPTQTPTPYVGVFLGQPTSVNEEGQVVIPPTIPPLAFQLPGNNSGSTGIIPAVPNAVQSTTGSCSVPVADPFLNAYNTNPSLQGFGCPRDSGTSLTLVTQGFERGRMFWRDTLQMIAVANSGSYWRMRDSWNDSLPADDPALVPPGGLLQPVRGFGFAWRNNPSIRDTLGWAVETEIPVNSFWQDFDGGTLFLGTNGQIYAIPSAESGQYSGGIAQ